MSWSLHTTGEVLDIRGITADRSYKYLLLVNGRNMNMKTHQGARSELSSWDLNDIKKLRLYEDQIQ